MIETTSTFYEYSTYKYRYTKSRVTINAIDLTAKSDVSDLSVNYSKYFYPSQLVNNVRTAPIYATEELNEFLLDGSRTLLNDTITDEEIGWWSELSDFNGDFTNNPILTIDFTSTHSSIGLSFYYDKWSYPLSYKVRWYRNGTLLNEQTFSGSSAVQVADAHIQAYDKIELEIVKAKPYAYCKLLEVDFGYDMVLTGDELNGGKLIEQVSLMSNQLISDSLEFSIFNYESKFNLLNPNDVMIYFTKGQSVSVESGVMNLDTEEYEYVNMGKFLLSSVTNSEGMLKIKCYGRLNFLNEENFYSPFYTNETVENIAADILDGYSYYVHENVASKTLTGYIPLQSKKEALKVLCIAAGAVAKEERDGAIYIFRPTKELSNNQIVTALTKYQANGLAPFLRGNELPLPQSITPIEDVLTITRDARIGQMEVTREAYYHKVNVTQKSYIQNGASEELFNDTVLTDEEGLAVINFNAPCYDLSLPTGSYTLYPFADCVALVGDPNTSYSITITGRKYTVNESTISATRDLSENLNNETLETMTLDTANELIGTNTTAQDVASWYLEQLKKRLNVSFNWWSVATVEASDWANIIDSFNNTDLMQTSYIEYDLSSLIAKVKGVI